MSIFFRVLHARNSLQVKPFKYRIATKELNSIKKNSNKNRVNKWAQSTQSKSSHLNVDKAVTVSVKVKKKYFDISDASYYEKIILQIE